MQSPNPDPIGHDATKELRDILFAQTRLLDALIHELTTDEQRRTEWDSDVLDVVPLMIHALGVSIHSTLKLCGEQDMGVRDAYGIARSAAELSVNVCFIAAVGSDAATRASRHAMQKSYRDLQRKGSIGGLELSVSRPAIPAKESLPGLAEALAEFTGKKGQELADWTPASISERIEMVRLRSEGAGTALAGSIFSIYRHSSELLHGTYFGVVHFWRGSGTPATTRKAFSEVWDEHFLTIFNGLYFAANGVLVLSAEVFGLPKFKAAQSLLHSRLRSWLESTGQPEVTPESQSDGL